MRRPAATDQPEIYGVAFASSNQLKDLNVPLNRSGGNTTTRTTGRSMPPTAPRIGT